MHLKIKGTNGSFELLNVSTHLKRTEAFPIFKADINHREVLEEHVWFLLVIVIRLFN